MYIPFDRPKKATPKKFQNLRLAKKQHAKTISKLNREKYVKRASIVILSTQLVLKYKKTHALFTYNSKQVVKNFQKAKKRWFQNNCAVPLPVDWTPRLNKTTTLSRLSSSQFSIPLCVHFSFSLFNMNEKLWTALSEIQSGNMTTNAAAAKFGISSSTLYRRTENVAPNPPGRKKIFSDFDEHLLATKNKKEAKEKHPCSTAGQ